MEYLKSYRIGLEYPYPIPFDDCYKVTRYIMKNSSTYRIDSSRLVLAGDVVGGTMVASITQQLARLNLPQPKIQVLIYPILQFAFMGLPSIIRFRRTGVDGVRKLGIPKFAQRYFGIGDYVNDVSMVFNRSEHFALIQDQKEFDRIKSILDISKIDDKYKPDMSIYRTHKPKISYSKLANDSILVDNYKLSGFFKKLFEPQVSPLFALDKDLENLPRCYFISVEEDFLKDEGLLYANRLNDAVVDLTLQFYKNAKHGVFTFGEEFSMARKIQNELIRFLIEFL